MSDGTRGLLFQLIRFSLWGEKISMTGMGHKEYGALMETASRQTVEGLVANALIENGVRLEKYDAINTYSLLGTLRQQNDFMNKELAGLCQLMRENKIKFVVMKGQTVSARYPQPRDRVIGDIDFYCPPSDFQKACEVIQNQWHAEIEENEVEKHVAFLHNDVDYELHSFLNEFCSKSSQQYFDELVERSVEDWNGNPSVVTVADENVPVLTPALDIAFSFVHLYMHLQELGVGLRQFCDLAMLCHDAFGRGSGEATRKELKQILTTLGYVRAFRAVGAVLVDCLGLSPEEFPFAIENKDRRYKEYILDIVFKRGNFGKYGRKNMVGSGIGYLIEATWVKVSHYLRLFPLSPKENSAMLFNKLPLRIKNTITRQG